MNVAASFKAMIGLMILAAFFYGLALGLIIGVSDDWWVLLAGIAVFFHLAAKGYERRYRKEMGA